MCGLFGAGLRGTSPNLRKCTSQRGGSQKAMSPGDGHLVATAVG